VTETLDIPKVVYFTLNGDEGFKQSCPDFSLPRTHTADGIAESVDPWDYYRDGLFTRRQKIGSLHLLETKLAPNFVIPRHHHNTDQLVLVLEGSARQGRRWFQAGDGYFTKGMVPYTTAAGPEGAKLLEIRKDPIEELETWWDEDKPSHWERSFWDTTPQS
jgi:hypothetical protein